MNALVIVTGSSKGLGKAIAEESVRRGNLTVGLARSAPAISGAENYIHLTLDVTDELRCREAMRKAHELAGQHSIDKSILIANAGKYTSAPLKDLRLSAVQEAIETNYYTYVSSVLSFIGEFSSGTIVGIGGYNTLFASPKSASYGAAKKAVMRFGDSLRLELPKEKYQVLSVYAHTINTWTDERVSGAMDRHDVARMLLDVTSLYKTIAIEEMILAVGPDAG